MIVTKLELVDFRNYREASFDFHPGITAVVGLNGQGKRINTTLKALTDAISALNEGRGDLFGVTKSLALFVAAEARKRW